MPRTTVRMRIVVSVIAVVCLVLATVLAVVDSRSRDVAREGAVRYATEVATTSAARSQNSLGTAVTVPMNTVLADASALRRLVLLLALGGLLVAGGDLTHRVADTGDREVLELGASFNRFVDTVARFHAARWSPPWRSPPFPSPSSPGRRSPRCSSSWPPPWSPHPSPSRPPHSACRPAGLGVLAGAVQTRWGSQIPQWTGDKRAPVALGLLTVVLSLMAGVAAAAAHREGLSTAHRAFGALALLVPGLLCFTTVGRLWYLPGAVLVVAGSLAVDGWGATAVVVRAHWMRCLPGLLGATDLLMAAAAPPLTTALAAGSRAGLLAAAVLRPDGTESGGQPVPRRHGTGHGVTCASHEWMWRISVRLLRCT